MALVPDSAKRKQKKESMCVLQHDQKKFEVTCLRCIKQAAD